jgi:hypothetical protein
MKFTGHASGELPGDVHTSWLEASTLGWLKGYDKVILTEPPQAAATFTLVEDNHRVACRFTRADSPLALCWEGDDGSSGSLALESRGETTWADYHAVYVPKATADKVAAGLIGAFARGKAQRETDNDAASELSLLARRVKRRAGGRPADDRAPRSMLELCCFGAGTPDAGTVPVFDAQGQLVMAPGETVLWTGTATPAAEAAQAAGGREQFAALWKSVKKAAITLTTQRLVYDIRKFTEGKMSWIIVGGATGGALTALSAARASAHRSGRTMAGHIRHENLANLLTGANARSTFAGPATVTATLVEPPKRAIRVRLIADSPAEDLARQWTQAAGTERLQRLASLLTERPDKRDQLLGQQHDPKPRDGYWGPLWALPLPCFLGQDRPMG